MNFIVQGYRSARGKKRHSYFQPMSCIEIVFYYKDTRELQKITESNLKIFFHTLQSDPAKITLGVVGLEIFDHAVKEHEQNFVLYDFLKQFLLSLETNQDPLIHHFLFFLVHLTTCLGFFPHVEAENPEAPLFFDLLNGTVMNVPVRPNTDRVLLDFISANPENCRQISLNNAQKKNLIAQMLEYYKHHIEGFRDPESLKVFEEVMQ